MPRFTACYADGGLVQFVDEGSGDSTYIVLSTISGWSMTHEQVKKPNVANRLDSIFHSHLLIVAGYEHFDFREATETIMDAEDTVFEAMSGKRRVKP